MRVLLAAAALVLLAVPTAGSTVRPPTDTQLSIAVWPQGRGDGKPVKQISLRCGPPRGSHPTPARACARLKANLGALQPVPPGRLCGAVAGGREQAFLSGRVNGRRVRAAFNRKNLCEIARWNRLAPLFQAQAPATSLAVTVWPEGRGRSYATTLTCSPVGGTNPSPAQACARLMEFADPFAPLPLELPCVLVSSGPQVAVVRGSFRWKPVEAQFDRSDSCETRRWDRVAILFAAP